MKQIALLFISFFLFNYSNAQYTYMFISEPDSAGVFINGELKGYTPCKVKFRWRDAINKQINFSVEKKGFKTITHSITNKPTRFDFNKNVYFEPSYEVFYLDSSSQLIAFDKLMVNFTDGKVIGQKRYLKAPSEDIKWKGSVKVGDDFFEEKFYEVINKMGFHTVSTENSKLFSDEVRSRPKLPRFILGAEIISYQLEIIELKKSKDYTGNFRLSTEMEIEWNVLDKSTGKVTLKEKIKTNYSSIESRYSYNEKYREMFELSLIKFVGSQKFVDIVQNNESLQPLISDSPTLNRSVKNASIPTFNENSEMIKHVSASCVTIITDGGHGSGVIINDEGYVLSAYHVVEGVNQIDVKFSNGLTLQASILAFDYEKDVVLLDINGSGFQGLPITKDLETQLGEDVFTIGTPADLELGQSIARGIVSGKRKNEGQIYIQADISVSPGNSGGPLLNKKGEIIGIIQRKIMREGVEGIGFAIPISETLEGLNLTIN